MIDKHEGLLAKIQEAEKLGLALYNSGAKVDGIVKLLRRAGQETGARIRGYRKMGVEAGKNRKPKRVEPA